MKTSPIFRVVLVALFFTISLGACKKESDPEPQAGVVFWSSASQINRLKADCYIDGQLIGTLSKISSTNPGCSDSGSPTRQIAPGTHTLEYRLSDGQVVKENVTAVAGNCYDFRLTF